MEYMYIYIYSNMFIYVCIYIYMGAARNTEPASHLERLRPQIPCLADKARLILDLNCRGLMGTDPFTTQPPIHCTLMDADHLSFRETSQGWSSFALHSTLLWNSFWGPGSPLSCKHMTLRFHVSGLEGSPLSNKTGTLKQEMGRNCNWGPFSGH